VTAVATTSNEIPKVNPVVDQTPVKAAFSGATVDLAGASSGIVVFKVRGPSWVEVTDGKGVVQLRKTMSIGESIGASGVLPLSVVVGRADVTDVEVKGKPFSLAAIAKDNVARFEVK
jgi:cytoskeleton protein RodZ